MLYTKSSVILVHTLGDISFFHVPSYVIRPIPPRENLIKVLSNPRGYQVLKRAHPGPILFDLFRNWGGGRRGSGLTSMGKENDNALLNNYGKIAIHGFIGLIKKINRAWCVHERKSSIIFLGEGVLRLNCWKGRNPEGAR